MSATPNKSNQVWLWILPIAGLFILPFLALLVQLFDGAEGIWQHLWSTVLNTYLIHSVLLMVLVGLGAAVIGVSTAWLVAVFQFPGRKQFEWLLILPMAMPAYIVAYAYTWLLDVSGPIQTWIRSTSGWSFGEYFFPNIRSFGGAVLMLMLVLYPYVYLLCRAAFINQSRRLWEVNQSMGGTMGGYFYKIALPLARPALFGGLALVLMETLADYGTVEFFGVQTLTMGVFKSWFGLGSLAAAAQVSAIILLVLVVILWTEKKLRGGAKYDVVNAGQVTTKRHQLNGWKKWLAVVWCGLIVTLGFVLPILILCTMVYHSSIQQWWLEFIELTWHSISLAVGVALLTVLLATLMVSLNRYQNNPALQSLIKTMSMGYAIPGLVIAVGVTIAFGWLDGAINGALAFFDWPKWGLIFSGGFLALITAYVIRFLAVAVQPIESGYAGISKHMDEASILTGKSHVQTFMAVHLPLLRGGLLTALLLVFVDLLKELPATLVLRPFNFNTLAVKTYELASDERLADSALPALCIVAVGVLPVLWINQRIIKSS